MGLTRPETTVRRTIAEMWRPRRRSLREKAFEFLLVLFTVVGIAVLGVLLVDVLVNGTPRLDWQFLTSYSSRFPEQTGILAGLTGTVSLMVLTALLSFPIGVAAAIYLEEFAPDNWFTRLMQVNIANLAGVPSVVYGLLAASLFVFVLELGRSLMSGALALTLLSLPVIIVAGREAIRAVPRSIREGGLALGATPWQVTRSQVLPAAMPGILTGTILALSRAIGEAAPVIVAGAAFSRRAPNEPWNVLEPFVALPVVIFDFVKRPQEGFRIDAASAAIIALLVALLAMNTLAILLRNRYRTRF